MHIRFFIEINAALYSYIKLWTNTLNLFFKEETNALKLILKFFFFKKKKTLALKIRECKLNELPLKNLLG